MDPGWNATDSDDWEHIPPPDCPPSRKPSFAIDNTSWKTAPGGLEKSIPFFDLLYDHTQTEILHGTKVSYPNQTRDTTRHMFSESKMAAASDAPVEPSTKTDVKSSVSRSWSHSEKTAELRSQKYENRSAAIEASPEISTGPDAPHSYNSNSLRSSTSNSVNSPVWYSRPARYFNNVPSCSEKNSDETISELELSWKPDDKPRLWPPLERQLDSSDPIQSPFSIAPELFGADSGPYAVSALKKQSRATFRIPFSYPNALLETANKAESATLRTVLNKYIVPNTDLIKGCSDHVIPGFLNSQHTIDATGDTGAKYNFLNEAYAKRCKFKIDPTSRRLITIASGQKVMTRGIAEVAFSFRDEQTPYPLKFHILPGCIKNVILGKSFLKATKTFSSALNFAKRVVKRFARTLSTHQVLFLGASPPMFAGLLNGETKTALADSASKVLIMDENYARMLGLSIVSTKKTCIKLRFADGSTAFTSGKTYNVTWQFGTGKRYHLDFYILKNAPADVILSEDFLLRETKAFIEYADCLMEEDDDEDSSYYDDDDDNDDDHFFAIYRDENYHPQAYTEAEGADQYFEDDREDSRRAEEDLNIASLVGTEKDAAIARAQARRAQWAANQAAHILAHGSQHCATNTASSSAAQHSQTGNAAGGILSSNRPRWRFKLMKKRKSGQSGQKPRLSD